MTRLAHAPAALGVALVALVALAGCGSVSARQDRLEAQLGAPTSTAPSPSTPALTSATTTPPEPTTTTSTGPSGPSVPTVTITAIPGATAATTRAPAPAAAKTTRAPAGPTAVKQTPKVTPKPTPKPAPTPPPAAPSPPPVTTPTSDPSWQACRPVIGGVTVSVAAGQRSVTVVNGNGGTSATVTFAIRTNTPCGFVTSFTDGGGRVGYGGISSGAARKQGTGTTPTGTYTMTEAFGISANPGSSLSYRHVGAGDFWVEDNNSAFYNSYRNESEGGFDSTLPLSDPNGSERLSDYPGQYSYAIVVNFNRAPDSRVPYRGAGIFLHVRGNGATAGCVAVSSGEMVTMLRLMRSGDTVTIVP